MIPTPIQSALAALRDHQVPVLLLGGQASILYGGAEFSRDLDLLLAATPTTVPRLEAALADLEAELIAVPPLDLAMLARGHAVHYRCGRMDVRGLRLDIMTRPPRLIDVEGAWRRAVDFDLAGLQVPVVALEDLILTKKTQRDKDWAIIGTLVRADMVRHGTAGPERRRLWFREAREADDLVALAAAFPVDARAASVDRPLLESAMAGDRAALELALAEEQIKGKQADRDYWAPLRAELEQIRHDYRRGRAGGE